MIDLVSLFEPYGLIGLAVINFLSSSVLPVPSEPAIIAATSIYDPFVVLVFTMFGAMLGSIMNYYIGLKGIRHFFFDLFKREKKHDKESRKWIEKYGLWSLLIVQWIPIIGDPVMVLMGALKIDFKKFFVFLFVGELIKAVVLVYFGVYLFALF